jgi:hypothetical protein
VQTELKVESHIVHMQQVCILTKLHAQWHCSQPAALLQTTSR